jgi:hypothetical protein
VRRDRRELELVGVLAAESDQLAAEYRDRHRLSPGGLSRAITAYVTRDLGHSGTMPTEEAEALIHEAAMIGVLVGVKIGRGG